MPRRLRESKASDEFKTISLFSGAMGFDLGLEQAGLNTRVCVEFDRDCCATIRLNRPDLAVIERDIREVTTQEILDAGGIDADELFCIVGGPPCQPFSSGGKRHSIMDPRGSLFMEFVRIIREARPKYFVFENVAHIVTAAMKHRPIAERPGQNWNLSAYTKQASGGYDDGEPLQPEEMSGSAISVVLEEFEQLGYFLTYGILNAADVGVPQRRYRFVLIGSRVAANVRLPRQTHSIDGRKKTKPWVTLREALRDIDDPEPLHSSYTDEFKRFFDHVPPGGNWRALPAKLQPKALGGAYDAGGGKTGFFRRLSWDEPSPTIVGKPNRKSCAICHPEHTRPLTVRECARIQGFPDDWRFTGGMHRQYLQIGNAVPVGLGLAVGKALLRAHEAASDEPREFVPIAAESHRANRTELLELAKRVLRASARNRVARRSAEDQPSLFG